MIYLSQSLQVSSPRQTKAVGFTIQMSRTSTRGQPAADGESQLSSTHAPSSRVVVVTRRNVGLVALKMLFATDHHVKQ